jgi:hypothetical protein
MVDQPRLGVTGSGAAYVSWVCQTQPGGIGALALWAVQSTDGGASWSTPVNVSSRRILWSELIATQGSAVHLLWKEFSNGRIHLWHATKPGDDAGWQPPQEIASLEGGSDAVAAAVDAAQQVYLVHFANQGSTPAFLYWRWNGSDWISGDTTLLEGSSITGVTNLTAAVSEDGRLGLLFNGRENTSGLTADRLYFTSRAIAVPDEPVIALATAAALPATTLAAPEATPTPTLAPTPTATEEPIQNFEETSAPPRSMNALIIGAALVILLIGGVVFLQARSRFHP